MILPAPVEKPFVIFKAKKSDSTEAKLFYYYVDNGNGCNFVPWRGLVIAGAHFFAVLMFYYAVYERRLHSLIFSNLYGMVSAIGITGGAHRLWSHKSYSARFPFRLALMFAQIATGQATIRHWVEAHRVHHKWTNTDADPHTTSRGLFYAHIGWFFMVRHPEYFVKVKTLDFSDLDKDPVIRLQERFYWPIHLFFAFVLPMTIHLYFFEETLLAAFSYASGRQAMVLHIAALVNSAAHVFSDRPFSTEPGGGTDLSWVSLLSWGEGYHNYHHTFPRDYRAAELGSKLNPTKFSIDSMASLGQTYNLITTSSALVEAAKARVATLSSHSGHSHAEAPDSDYDTLCSSKSA